MAITTAISGRERVLREARALFFERGYAEVSMQQIADAAGMTKAALYYHFRDKNDLFAEVVVREMTLQRERIERLLAVGGTLRQVLENVARLYFDQLSPDLLRVMADFREHVPESHHTEVHQELDRFVAMLTGLFERAAASGELRDIPPRLGAFVFFHTLMASVLQSMRDQQLSLPPDPAAAARLIASIVLHGIAGPQDRDE